MNSMVIVAPETGLPSASTTLPLTMSDWASAAGATAEHDSADQEPSVTTCSRKSVSCASVR